MNKISDCEFYGVKWDGKAIDAVNNVAKALLNLTELFKSQNIKIDALLKIDNIDDIEKYNFTNNRKENE